MRIKRIAIFNGISFVLLLVFLLFSKPVLAGLSLKYITTIKSIRIYQDEVELHTYYYSPGNIVLAIDNQGKPSLKFLQMRYSGSQATGDQGLFRYKSLLQFQAQFQPVRKTMLDSIRSVLKVDTNAVFFPLPLYQVRSYLIYALAGSDTKKEVVSGYFEGNDEKVADASSLMWAERTFTVSLDNESSQVFWNALSNGQTIISLSYAYFVKCNLSGDESLIEITGSPEVTGELSEFFSSLKLNQDSLKKVEKVHLVHADAFEIRFDSKKYPELVYKIDINESRIPPDFAVLEVRCYDYQNEGNSELYARSIEIEATGMNNKPVGNKTVFYAYEQEINMRSIKFPYAVRMNLPYRYRIINIYENGSRKYSKWITQNNWVNIIDITNMN